jgi:hypothetical protein
MIPSPLAPLAALRQFIVCRLDPLPNGKTDKLPIDPRTWSVTVKGSGGAFDPGIWMTYDEAAGLAAGAGPQFAVGFVITDGCGFWCLDIDGALQADRTWSALSQELCAALPGTVVEVSQSRRGLHIWGRGPIPQHKSKNVALGLELYSRARFVVLGSHAQGQMAATCPGVAAVVERYFKPDPGAGLGAAEGDGPRADWRGPTDDAELIRRALQSRSAASVFGETRHASFADLWERNVDVLARAYPASGGGDDAYDESSADAALAAHLAFWTGCDQARMERLMRASALVREKWERADYLPRTIRGACSRQREVLQDRPSAVPEPAPTVAAAAAAAAPAPARSDANPWLRPEDQQRLFAGCVYVVDKHRVLVPGGKLLKPEQFKSKFGGYVFVMDANNERTSKDAFEAFTQSQILRWPRADGVVFRPDLPPASLVEECGEVLANTWWPAEVEAHPGGGAQPFLAHVRKLFPDPHDFSVLMGYLAACVQCPGVKFQWAPLVIGVEGNGKTLLSVVTAHAVGERYVHWPAADKLGSGFNSWMFGKLLYCVEDIHAVEDRAHILEKLKPMVTASRGYEIEQKGVDQFSARICGNFIFNSNHWDAIRKTRNDRRYAVLGCAQQSVDDLARDGMTGTYVADIYEWLEAGGFAETTWLLRHWQTPAGYNPAVDAPRAPRTTSTDAAIAQSLGPAEQEILEAIESERVGFRDGWVSSQFLDALLRERRKDGAIPPSKRRGVMQALGYDWHPKLAEGRTNNVVMPDGAKVRLYVRAGHPSCSLATGAEVAAAYSRAQAL